MYLRNCISDLILKSNLIINCSCADGWRMNTSVAILFIPWLTSDPTKELHKLLRTTALQMEEDLKLYLYYQPVWTEWYGRPHSPDQDVHQWNIKGYC